MKYYSKSPGEFRRDLQESESHERSKRKKTYLLQIANFGILAVALIIMVKAPDMMKKGGDETEVPGVIEKNMTWKGWSAVSACKSGESCTLSLTRSANEMTADAFFWKVSNKVSGEVVLKTFELIPKDIKINETKNFRISLKGDNNLSIVTVHFMDNKNEELLSMQVYP